MCEQSDDALLKLRMSSDIDWATFDDIRECCEHDNTCDESFGEQYGGCLVELREFVERVNNRPVNRVIGVGYAIWSVRGEPHGESGGTYEFGFDRGGVEVHRSACVVKNRRVDVCEEFGLAAEVVGDVAVENPGVIADFANCELLWVDAR